MTEEEVAPRRFFPQDAEFARNLRWWGFYAVIQVVCHVVLSSVGAFFHFLLDHDINLVEGWLHESGWGLVLASKFTGLWAAYWLLKVRLYRPRSVIEYLRDEFRWPGQKVLVISVFLLLTLVLLGAPKALPQNAPYWWSHVMAFVSVVAWFLADVVMAAILQELFPVRSREGLRWRMACYLGSFALIFRLIVPDYYGTAFLVHLQFFTVLYLAGPKFRAWGECATFLFIVAAPAAALLGLDPLWGPDFSPFRLSRPPAAPFLLVVWMLSWFYYQYRHRWRWPFSA